MRSALRVLVGVLLAVFMAACGGNKAPVANAGPNQNVSTGSIVTIDGSGSSDADGDTLTYSWSFSSLPTGSSASLSDSTAVNPTFTVDIDGTYIAILVVNDGSEDSAADTVTITASSTTITATYKGSDYYPISIGNSWVYNLGTVEVDGETITINGVTYQVVKESVVNGCGEEDSDELHIAHSEESVVAHCNDCGIIGDLFVFLPKEMKVGDSWVTSLDSGAKIIHTFEGLEDITVPAGTFSDCLKIKVDVDGGDGYTEIFWYAKNVGWVKVERISETDTDGCIFVPYENPLAELQSATIDGVSYP